MAAKVAGLYDMEDTLGSGHFAVVKSARHVFTGLRVAIKVIDKTKLDDISKAHLYQEVRCMKLVSHRSIIRLYEVIDTQTKLYLIEELGDGGDLYDFIMKHPNGIEEELVRKIFKQTVSAIQYCHQLHVVHRDLKPENLVFCSSGSNLRVKLTDFGLSRTFMPGEMIESSCGSLEYSAPEILLGDSYDPPKVDVWSLGVILFMLIVGRSPFASGGANETLAHIMDGKYSLPPTVSECCRSLIRKMLVVDASQRVSLDEVVKHPFLMQDSDDYPKPLPTLNISDIPLLQVEYIVQRMQAGGYGERESILKMVKEQPYGSMAATFYLLAEAEHYRRLNSTHPLLTEAAHWKASSQPIISKSPIRSHSHVESGVLQPRRNIRVTHQADMEAMLRSPTHSSPLASGHNSPYQNPQYASPRLGVGGEQVSMTNPRKPIFPVQSVGETTEEIDGSDQESIDASSILRPRQLSACEEESESEQSTILSSPMLLHSPHSRRLSAARSSPTLVKSGSKSDASDEDEEDDLMELTTTSNSHISRTVLSSRLSPTASPLLSNRRSPTRLWSYSSDEELSMKYDSKRKHYSKRLRRFNKRVSPMVRVDSASSDDGSVSDRATRHSLPKFGKNNHCHTIQYASVPSTPADCSGSESFTELLAMHRPRSNSARTDSSDGRSEMGDLGLQISSHFELSDGEELEHSCDRVEENSMETPTVEAHVPSRPRTSSSGGDSLQRST